MKGHQNLQFKVSMILIVFIAKVGEIGAIESEAAWRALEVSNFIKQCTMG